MSLFRKYLTNMIITNKMFRIYNKLLKWQYKVSAIDYNAARSFNCTGSKRYAADKTPPKIPDEVPIEINGKLINVPPHFTILQALKREQMTAPTFCYHERLSIAGNCRMCLVEVEGWAKLQIACSTPINKGIKIRTNSPLVLTAQESVLEFLLMNHPLDCPICDQGGECDLQDLSMRFGNDRSRFTDIHFSGKRAVEDKNLGPLIRAEMTRCIHCTRCIRFGAQVCGLEVLGSAGRGEGMLVGTYVDKMFLSELSGNIIDLCPVGALTAVPYMFKARPWEVSRTNSIDVTDATGTNIVLNYRFDRVLRVLPREHEEINEEWLSDKGRWAIDSLHMQRLVTPMIREGDCLRPVEWHTALCCAAALLKKKPTAVMALAGPHSNVETLVVAKDLVNTLGSEYTFVESNITYTMTNSDIRAAYCLNVKMSDVATADRILLIGTNPRFEAPILNAWIRKAYRDNECDIHSIGPPCEFNYYVNDLGPDIRVLANIKDIFAGAKTPLIFVGIEQLFTECSYYIMCEVMNLALPFITPDWGVVNVVTQEASFAGALEAGWNLGGIDFLTRGKPSAVISLGADDAFYTAKLPADCPVIYVGFQGDRGAENAAVVLPGCAYTESGGLYMNMEGRSQIAMPAVTPPGKARQDWKIFRALAEYCGICFPYDDITGLNCRMGQISPNFCYVGNYQPKLNMKLIPSLMRPPKMAEGQLDIRLKMLRDYYCTDIFTYNSRTMQNARKAADLYVQSDYACN